MKNNFYLLTIVANCLIICSSKFKLRFLFAVFALFFFSGNSFAIPLLPSKTLTTSSAFIPSSFASVTNPFTMSMAFPGRILPGDYDNDGDVDILYQSTNTQGTGFGYVRNNGAGSFTDIPNATSAGTPFAGISFAGQLLNNGGWFVFDYDNDGDVDIIDRENTGTGNTLGVWRNNSGTFASVTNPFTMSMAFPGRILPGDYDNDGDVDILYQSTNTQGTGFGYVRNNGAGSFTDIPNATSAGTPFAGISFAGQLLNNGGWFVFDYDNDGDVDIIDRENTGTGNTLGVWRNNSGTFASVTNPFTMSMAFPGRILPGDYDNDGDVDILYQSTNTQGTGFGYVRNNGAGSFTDIPNATSAGTPFAGISFAGQLLNNGGWFVFDYDNDGDVDIIDRENTGTGNTLGVWQQSGTPPILSSTVPADNATNVSPTSNFTLTFDRSVTKGTGNLLVVQTSTNSTIETIPVTDARVTGSGTSWVVNPNATLGGGTAYAIQIQKGVFKDVDSRVFQGIINNTTYNITTALPPTITGLTATPNPICSGVTATFTATIGSITGSYAYTLTNGSSTTTGNTSSTAFSQAITTSGSGSQSFTLTVNNVNGITRATTNVTVNARPTASISPSTATLTCASPSVNLTASGGTAYQWSTGATTSVISANTAGTYSVTVTNAATGCFSTTSVTVNQDSSVPTVSISPSSATLTCTNPTVSLSAIGSGTLLWSTGATTTAISVNTTGTYSVTLTAVNGCTARASATVISNTTPSPLNLTVSNPLTCSAASTTLTATAGFTSYSFSAGASQQGGSAGNTAILSNPGLYSVTARNAAGCTSTASLNVSYQNCSPTVANAIPPQSATVGQSFSYTIAANTFTDPETPVNLVLSVSGLPAGLSFVSPSTITGTPSSTVGSPVSVTVVATDPGGLSVFTTFQLTIYPPCLSMVTVKAGNWNDISVWSCGRLPLISDVVTVNHAVTLPTSYQGVAQRVIYGPSGRLLFNSFSNLKLNTN
ncbi:VCBS repeat-containing protein [Spirosoma sp. BT702]|uniref:VCBS repeat-containing protein n=1 Tax=Spirosoma profusum TaxID=2771354 RepID=A0A926XT83_9BACT|nr:FG-GAP-like repeat-containing protein [Spirosoma profusum]MBD2699010.1 VCBS repeat-containing protein [Spirosoma profusum]